MAEVRIVSDVDQAVYVTLSCDEDGEWSARCSWPAGFLPQMCGWSLSERSKFSVADAVEESAIHVDRHGARATALTSPGAIA